MKTTRAEIAQAALRLMATKGYRGTSIGEIEKAVGLAPRAGGFYRHFKNKEEILFDAIDTYAEEILAELSDLKNIPQSSASTELTAMTHLIVAHAARHRELRLILRRDGRNLPGIQARIRQFNQADAWDVFVEWTRHQLGKRRIDKNVRQHTFQIFSTLALILYLQDYGEFPLSLDRDETLDHWIDQSIAYLRTAGVANAS